MRALEAFFWVVSGVLCGGVAMQGSTYREQLVAQEQMSELRVQALEDRTTANHLLSNGRFVRQWEPKSGHSIYTFKPMAKK